MNIFFLISSLVDCVNMACSIYIRFHCLVTVSGWIRAQTFIDLSSPGLKSGGWGSHLWLLTLIVWHQSLLLVFKELQKVISFVVFMGLFLFFCLFFVFFRWFYGSLWFVFFFLIIIWLLPKTLSRNLHSQIIFPKTH